MKVLSHWEAVLVSYSEEKRRWDRTYPWIYYGARPLSFLLTRIALWFHLTPNQVTFLSFLAGMGAFFLMAWGGVGIIAGSCLFALLNILDCVDGNMARMRQESSPLGKFYDAMVGLVFYLVYFALGLGLYRTPDSSLSLVLAAFGVGTIPPVVYLLLGAAATLSRYLVLQLQQLFHVFTRELDSYEEREKTEGSVPFRKRWYYRLYHNTTDVQGQDPILIGAAATGLAGLYLTLSAVVQFLNLIGLAIVYVRRARTLYRMTA